MSYLRTERSSVAATWSRESHNFVMLSKAKHLLTNRLQTLRSPQGDISHVGLPLFLLFLLASAFLVAAGSESSDVVTPELKPERHLHNIRQLTEGRQNAEAYFSFDGASLIFQSTRDGRDCYQEYVMALGSGAVRLVSTGQGVTTCGYFLPAIGGCCFLRRI